MTGIRKGDRVRVEFEGEVLLSRPDGDLWIYPDDTAATCVYSHVDWCTVITPPIKVGDVLTFEQLKQLAVGSVVARPGYAAHELRPDGNWHSTNGLKYPPEQMNIGVVVLRIGGGS